MKHILKVMMAEKEVGFLWVEDGSEAYRFEYSSSWQESGYAISPHLPLNDEIESGNVKRFLENLIPEGKGLEDITAFTHISKKNTFAIIKAIGYDTSGALMFGDEQHTDELLFREITDEELAERIEQIEEKSIVIWDQKERLSLAGVQEKLPVIIQNEKIGLGDGKLCSTHILKFQTKRHSNIVINEYFCMKLAKSIGLDVADVELKYFGKYPALLVKRFDRVYKAEEGVERVHVIDGCQMLNLNTTYKYERNFGSGRDVKDIREGASFSKLFASAKLCKVPAKAKLQMLQWAMFNLIIGNSDAHGKNFSFFVSEQGIEPTPFYDLLSILSHKEVEHDMAMAYGDEFNPNEIYAYQLRKFAEDIEIHYRLVSQTLQKQCKAIKEVLQHRFIPMEHVSKDEKLFLDNLGKLILQRVELLEEASKEMGKISF